MRIPAAKTISIVTIAAVAVLGAEYASASPNHTLSNPAGSGFITSTNAGILNAAPLGAPRKNIAHVYTTTTSGGTGGLDFGIPIPAPGVYVASFTANFFSEGTPTAPVAFSCSIEKNGAMVTQSTTESASNSGYYIGVNGSNTVKLASTDILGASCGTGDDSAWTWASEPLMVTLTRLDGMISGTLSTRFDKSSAAITR